MAMRNIGRIAALAAVAAVAGGIGMAAAQTGGQGAGPGFTSGRVGPGMMGGPGFMHGPSGGAAFDPTAHLDALKTELGIRPEQQAAWDVYAKAVRDQMAQMREARDSIDVTALRGMSWQEHQAFMAKLWDKRAEGFKAIQAAAGTLLAALDDTQKAHVLLPQLLGGQAMMASGGRGMMAAGGGPGMMASGGGPFCGFGLR